MERENLIVVDNVDLFDVGLYLSYKGHGQVATRVYQTLKKFNIVSYKIKQ